MTKFFASWRVEKNQESAIEPRLLASMARVHILIITLHPVKCLEDGQGFGAEKEKPEGRRAKGPSIAEYGSRRVLDSPLKPGNDNLGNGVAVVRAAGIY